jgi:TolB-like protein/Flp pilus assembly protein TadD
MSDSQQASPRRRLGVILFADVADYSRLMGDDEIGTWKAVQERIATIIEHAEREGGKVQQIRGDGLFLLFDSAVDAVGFAVRAQKRMKALNQGLAQDRQLLFRIGINLGEVLLDAQEVSGDSVNVAAQIATLARPGEVCITAPVYEQVRTRLYLGYSYLGSRMLEGSSEPVDAFQVHEDPATGTMATGYRGAPHRRLAPETLRGPSVVVLPFRFLDSDPIESWFADGLTEDITTNLSLFHDLFVIARASASVFGDGAGPPSRATRQLGVRYAVTGSVRKAGRRLRISVQLLDGETERVVWGEQYNRQLDDIFDLQEEITEVIVSAVHVNIAAIERERLRQLAPSDMRAYTWVLQGQQLIFRYTREDNRYARTLIDEALKFDPRYARAIAAKSRTLNIDCLFNWAEVRAEALDSALDLALTAVELDPTDARGHGEVGFAHLWRKEHDPAIGAYRRAIHLNPNDADLLADMAIALAFSGQSGEAVELLHKAMRLNPFYPDQYLWHLGSAYYNLERYEEAIQTVSRMQNPKESYRILAASHAQLGRMAEAQTYARKQLEVHPDFNVDHWAKVMPDAHEEEKLRYIEGLRKAGL